MMVFPSIPSNVHGVSDDCQLALSVQSKIAGSMDVNNHPLYIYMYIHIHAYYIYYIYTYYIYCEIMHDRDVHNPGVNHLLAFSWGRLKVSQRRVRT